MDLGYNRYANMRGPFMPGLMFLFHLAWKSRIKLPVLIGIGFMVLKKLGITIHVIDIVGRHGVPMLDEGNAEPDVVDEMVRDGTVAGDDDSDNTDSYTMKSDYSEDDDSEDNNRIYEVNCSVNSSERESDGTQMTLREVL